MSGGTIVIAGGVLRRLSVGGHVAVFAQYVQGLRRLGYRTLFVDRLAAGEEIGPVGPGRLAAAVDRLGGHEWIAVLDGSGESVLGISREETLRRCRHADALVNVMGYLTDPELLAGPEKRIFLDIDPGFGQMWHELGLADVLSGHDAFVTVGLCLGQTGSAVPTCGVEWIPILPPVVLDQWEARPPNRDGPVTSVVSWRGPFAPIEYEGRTYGLRAHEFRRFGDLPRRNGNRFELALDIDPADEKDAAALRAGGWELVPPAAVSGDTVRYRRFIEGSKAEVMIAKNMYVASHGGWFSDRSACYLATGRPVVAQDTGWSSVLPAGEGLLAFTDVDGAADALADVDRRYDQHCDAARALAEEHFDSDTVLTGLLESAGVG